MYYISLYGNDDYSTEDRHWRMITIHPDEMKEKQKKSPTGNFPLGVFSCSVPPPPPAVGWLVIIGSYQFPPSVILFLFEHKRGKRELFTSSFVCV